jgi:hypothetical protein
MSFTFNPGISDDMPNEDFDESHGLEGLGEGSFLPPPTVAQTPPRPTVPEYCNQDVWKLGPEQRLECGFPTALRPEEKIKLQQWQAQQAAMAQQQHGAADAEAAAKRRKWLLMIAGLGVAGFLVWKIWTKYKLGKLVKNMWKASQPPEEDDEDDRRFNPPPRRRPRRRRRKQNKCNPPAPTCLVPGCGQPANAGQFYCPPHNEEESEEIEGEE